MIELTLPLPPSVNQPYRAVPGRAAPNPMSERVTTEAIVEAYGRHGSVWAAAAELGVSGQTVSRRMKAVGHPTNKRWISDADRERIRTFYETTPPDQFDLEPLAIELGRSRQTICKEAGQMGLTSYRRTASAKKTENTKAVRAGWWSRNPHPRGMAGKKHTPATLEILSEASRKNWNTWKTFEIGPGAPQAVAERRRRLAAGRLLMTAENTYSRCRGGRREDLGDTYFRSSWEANYARYLNQLIRLKVVERWDYEPEKFWFDGVRSGTTNYTPDFRVFYVGDPRPEYVELKGFVTPKDRTKWRRMKKYHPRIKLVVITEKEYYATARKWSSSIPNWESDRGGGRKTGPRAKAGSGRRCTVQVKPA